MSAIPFPTSAADLTLDMLNTIVGEQLPGVKLTGFDIVHAKEYGEQMVSTAGRAILDLHYAAGAPADLPKRVILKLAFGENGPDYAGIVGPFYANEVNFYKKIRGELNLETPRTLGADYDPATSHFGLLLEDLTQRGGSFPNVLQPVTVAQVRGVLDTLAKLHARFWESPRFKTDLSWVQTHLEGKVSELLLGLSPALIQREIDTVSFKREMVQRLRTTGDDMLAGLKALHRHQLTLPQTLLHGDTHVGNTYLLPGDRGGLLDWQLMVRGYCMHDVSYLITTSLSIELRRANEQDLLKYYLEQLAANGVKNPPSFDTAWTELRRALHWGVYIGWLTTPITNYGWEINVMNHLRLTTAYEDHGTGKLIDQIR
jgi:aminoglycoside/choline kinase family phosphotransferase